MATTIWGPRFVKASSLLSSDDSHAQRERDVQTSKTRWRAPVLASIYWQFLHRTGACMGDPYQQPLYLMVNHLLIDKFMRVYYPPDLYRIQISHGPVGRVA